MLLCATPQGLHPDTMAAVMAHVPAAGRRVRVDVADVSASDFAYWEAIAGCWDGSDDLVVIEQDIVIHAGVIPQFLACSGDWCTFGYPGRDGEWLTDRLGCTRFSAALQRRVLAADFRTAGLLQVDVPAGAGAWLGWGARDSVAWPFLDMTISARLRTAHGLQPCVHEPGVEHRHDYGRETRS